MNHFLLLLFFISLSICSHATSWTVMNLDIEATLRSEVNGVLEKEIVLPKESILKFALSVGSRKYRKSDGSIATSRKGWYRYILLQTIPGLDQNQIDELNKKKLYISKTVTAGLSNTVISNTNGSPSDRIASNSDYEASTDEKTEACNLESMDQTWKNRCLELFNQIPHDALLFTLKTMKLNETEFKSDKCYKMRDSNGTAMAGVTKQNFQDQMANGLPNKCQFIINDTRDKLAQCRGRMYYVDLCRDSEKLVVKDFFNIGTGTCRKGRGFRNYANQNTTVLGAFFTNYKAVNFYNSNSKYNGLRTKIKNVTGRYWAPALMLFGLQNTNNNASLNGKYMHVSPYISSQGCPSVSWQNGYMVEALANNGPSLMVNFGHQMEDIGACTRE